MTHMKRFREESGLTQEQAAKISGVSRATIGRWEQEDGYTGANLEALLETYQRARDGKINLDGPVRIVPNRNDRRGIVLGKL